MNIQEQNYYNNKFFDYRQQHHLYDKGRAAPQTTRPQHLEILGNNNEMSKNTSIIPDKQKLKLQIRDYKYKHLSLSQLDNMTVMTQSSYGHQEED